jgi:hypothetical protein
LEKSYPKISRKEQNPDFKRLTMEMVEGIAMENVPLPYLDRDKTSKEAD